MPNRAVVGLGLLVLIVPWGLSGCGEFPSASESVWGELAVLDVARVQPAVDAETAVELHLAAGQACALANLGASDAGDEWLVEGSGGPGALSGLVLVLLDGEDRLLVRERLGAGVVVRHVLRAATDRLQVGVMPLRVPEQAVTVRLTAGMRAGQPIPEPQGQLVWLNFGGATGVVVHQERAISFGPLEGRVFGDAYVEHTDTIKAEILRAMREHYAAYEVTIVSSDEAPRPDDPHSVVHFGGTHDHLLGLGDAVDRYNDDPNDVAVVYVEAFQAYAGMLLTPEQVGQMAARVASHELGHLLGLYHCWGDGQLMDDACTAWELVGPSELKVDALSPKVFPCGYEDGPMILAQTVGWRAEVELTE